MKKITKISGKTIPLVMDNVDTDLIIPAQYLTAITKKGYGENLFRRLREADPAFVFNLPKFSGANILIASNNFGCGSSREHAVWALQEYGIDAVIASSFADIFFSNSAKNGLLLITQPDKVVAHLQDQAQSGNYILNIDVEKLKITSPTNEAYSFTMDPFRQHCFINGIDELDYLLSFKNKIQAHEEGL